MRQVIKEGADAVCYKPFDMPQLLDTLAHLTREHPPKAPANPRCEVSPHDLGISGSAYWWSMITQTPGST